MFPYSCVNSLTGRWSRSWFEIRLHHHDATVDRELSSPVVGAKPPTALRHPSRMCAGAGSWISCSERNERSGGVGTIRKGRPQEPMPASSLRGLRTGGHRQPVRGVARSRRYPRSPSASRREPPARWLREGYEKPAAFLSLFRAAAITRPIVLVLTPCSAAQPQTASLLRRRDARTGPAGQRRRFADR